jgi:hypothetical protein
MLKLIFKWFDSSTEGRLDLENQRRAHLRGWRRHSIESGIHRPSKTGSTLVPRKSAVNSRRAVEIETLADCNILKVAQAISGVIAANTVKFQSGLGEDIASFLVTVASKSLFSSFTFIISQRPPDLHRHGVSFM